MCKYKIHMDKELVGKENEFREVEGERVIFQGFEEFSFFAHQIASYGSVSWHISEEKSGYYLKGDYNSKDEALKDIFQYLLDAGRNQLREKIEKYKMEAKPC
jgi:hypothetical protein